LNPVVAKTVSAVRRPVASARKASQSVGFVPTMGALHAGHARLIETARSECGFLVVSIFVNPLQFGPNEDYGRYPRAFAADVELCRKHGVDLIFAPAVGGMFPGEQWTFVEVTKAGDHLCGAFRPGHFRGMATVVLKLFNIVQPDRAYFGEKDVQQLAIIGRMVRDLSIPLTIVGVPTVREADGLAMSSRNQYLDSAQRQAAPVLYRALLKARELAQAGERDASIIKSAALEILRAQLQARVQYLELIDGDMQPVARVVPGVRAAGAAYFGATRLIDNILCL
jgi:pantoate--beta-alanine ligase